MNRAPRTHWAVLGVVLVTVFVALCVHGFAERTIRGSSTISQDRSPGFEELAEAGPLVDVGNGDVRSMHVPAGQIALTFDDGPDPRWTPAILDVLDRHGVPATFFVLGSQAVSHPDLVRRMVDDGHVVGNHTFTHTDLAAASTMAGEVELRMTQVALTAASGRSTVLLRPPYSSIPSAVRADTMTAWRPLLDDGYLLVLSDLDGKDWSADATVDSIVEGSTPVDGAGGIVLLHDGGGDRARTVEAVDRLIGDLQARGYRFVTVADLAGLQRDDAMPFAGRLSVARSTLLPAVIAVGNALAGGFTVLAMALAGLAVLRSLLLVWAARRHVADQDAPDPAFTPSVSVLIPAYNEAAGVEAAVTSLASSVYAGFFEVLVIDDGSTDDTAERVRALVAAHRWSHVRLITRPNGGKSAALNTGLAAARGEIVVTVDGDTVLEPDAVALLVQPFRNASVGAVSGNTKVANRGGLVGRLQSLEYAQGFNLDRRLYDRWRCMPTVPGAIGAFRRSALLVVGGFSGDTLAEDTDLTMALHRAGHDVAYEGRAVAWTEAPSTWRDLWKQRYRWSYGTMQAAWKHRRAVIERGHGGHFGRVGLPYLVVFQVALAVIAPVVDIFTIYGMLFFDRRVMAAYWLGFTAMQAAIAAYALHLDGERRRAVWALPFQQFVFRQLMYLVVVQSLATIAYGARTGWHRLRRIGVGLEQLGTPGARATTALERFRPE